MRRLLTVLSVVVLSACDAGIAGPMAVQDAGDEDAGATGGGGGSAATGGGGGGASATGGGMGTDDAGFDAGTTATDAGTDAGSDLVDVFVMVGKQGRRAISCDDGRTWKNDVSVDEAWPAAERYRCFSGTLTLPDGGSQSTDCDHNAYSSTALAFTGDAFIHTMGWGAPGTFYRSTDGVDWSLVFTGANVQDVMVGPNKILAATRYSRASIDDGASWTSGAEIPLDSAGNTIWNVRGGVYGGSAFLVVGQDGSNTDFAYSTDDGATWQRPQLQGGGRIDGCGAGKPASGGGVFVTVNGNAGATLVCRSTDDAATWTTTTVSNFEAATRPVWNGSQFFVWSGDGHLARSTDGATWTVVSTQTRNGSTLSGGPSLGAVAVNAAGTFVGTKGGWQVWYEQQRFYRSTDGITWDELDEPSAKRSHPITVMAAGRAVRSAVCP